jgi:hypothetical protein
MTGTLNWVTYGIPNTAGTVTVVSSKAITAGINAGSDAVGYGGFFCWISYAACNFKIRWGLCSGNCTYGRSRNL